jgi:hypothetical protein
LCVFSWPLCCLFFFNLLLLITLWYLQTLLTALFYFCPLFICIFWGENVFFHYLLFAFVLVWRGCKICYYICISKFQRLSFSMLFLATFIDVKKVSLDSLIIIHTIYRIVYIVSWYIPPDGLVSHLYIIIAEYSMPNFSYHFDIYFYLKCLYA